MLSIVILTWNSSAFIVQCLNSLSSLTCAHEIIVIDNGSSDSTVVLIESEFPDVTIIQNTSNLGVARGRNQGIRASKGEYILVLDVDTEMQIGTIEALKAILDSHDEYALVGPKLVYPDGTIQESCRKFPLPLGKLGRRLKLLKWAAKLDTYSMPIKQLMQVDYVIGACQLFKRSTLTEVGLLDEGMFYGPEDVDFCLRIWKNGRKVVYAPECYVVHHEQRVTAKKFLSRISMYHAIALIRYYRKHRYFFTRRQIYRAIVQATIR